MRLSRVRARQAATTILVDARRKVVGDHPCTRGAPVLISPGTEVAANCRGHLHQHWLLTGWLAIARVGNCCSIPAAGKIRLRAGAARARRPPVSC